MNPAFGMLLAVLAMIFSFAIGAFVHSMYTKKEDLDLLSREEKDILIPLIKDRKVHLAETETTLREARFDIIPSADRLQLIIDKLGAKS